MVPRLRWTVAPYQIARWTDRRVVGPAELRRIRQYRKRDAEIRDAAHRPEKLFRRGHLTFSERAPGGMLAVRWEFDPKHRAPDIFGQRAEIVLEIDVGSTPRTVRIQYERVRCC